jgi:hypothetical protein
MLVHRWSNDRPLPAHVVGKRRSAAGRGGRIEVVAAEERLRCATLAAQGGLATRLRRGNVAEIVAALPADIPVGWWGVACRIGKRWGAAIVYRRWLYRMATDLK